MATRKGSKRKGAAKRVLKRTPAKPGFPTDEESIEQSLHTTPLERDGPPPHSTRTRAQPSISRRGPPDSTTPLERGGPPPMNSQSSLPNNIP